jgi:hypothetical protein
MSGVSGVGHLPAKFGAVRSQMFSCNIPAQFARVLTKADEEWFRRPLFAALKGKGLSTDWYYNTSADTDRTGVHGWP